MNRGKRFLSLFLALTLAFSLALPAQAAESAMGTTLRLSEAKGTVTVKNAAGKDVKARSDMRLYNDYTIKTGKDNSAYIALDDSKAIQLDANSNVKIKKSGKQLEVSLTSGQLFFNVTKPLKSTETLNIRSQDTITGVRGTAGVVTEKLVAILHGTVDVTILDSGSDENRSTEQAIAQVKVAAGEMLDIIAAAEAAKAAAAEAAEAAKTGEPAAQAAAEAAAEAAKAAAAKLEAENIPAMVVEAMKTSPTFAEAVQEALPNLNVDALIESLPEKQAAEAKQAEEKQTEAEKQAQAQDAQIQQLNASDGTDGVVQDTNAFSDAAEAAAEAAAAAGETPAPAAETPKTNESNNDSDSSSSYTPPVTTTAYAFFYATNTTWKCVLDSNTTPITVPNSLTGVDPTVSDQQYLIHDKTGWYKVTLRDGAVQSGEQVSANEANADGFTCSGTYLSGHETINAATPHGCTSSTVFLIAEFNNSNELVGCERKVGVDKVNIRPSGDLSGLNLFTLCDAANNVRYAFVLGKSIYSVGLELNGGTLQNAPTLTAERGAGLYGLLYNSDGNALYTPQKADYKFTGWYKNAAATAAITSSDTVTGNTTVYAGWKKLVKLSVATKPYFSAVTVKQGGSTLSQGADGNYTVCADEDFTVGVTLSSAYMIRPDTVPTAAYGGANVSFTAAGSGVYTLTKQIASTATGVTTIAPTCDAYYKVSNAAALGTTKGKFAFTGTGELESLGLGEDEEVLIAEGAVLKVNQVTATGEVTVSGSGKLFNYGTLSANRLDVHAGYPDGRDGTLENYGVMVCREYISGKVTNAAAGTFYFYGSFDNGSSSLLNSGTVLSLRDLGIGGTVYKNSEGGPYLSEYAGTNCLYDLFFVTNLTMSSDASAASTVTGFQLGGASAALATQNYTAGSMGLVAGVQNCTFLRDVLNAPTYHLIASSLINERKLTARDDAHDNMKLSDLPNYLQTAGVETLFNGQGGGFARCWAKDSTLYHVVQGNAMTRYAGTSLPESVLIGKDDEIHVVIGSDSYASHVIILKQ